MKNTKNYNFIYALLMLAFFAFGCSFGNIKAEENTSENQNRTQYRTEEKSVLPNQNFDVSSVIGKYDYDTEKDGEGYDNSLEVTAANDGKLFIYISGSYIYKIGETQSMHEAEGKGDATLNGSRADATLVDETGKPCRATIIFKHQTADVKIPDTCQFNVALDGIYKKAGSENKPTRENPNDTKSNLSEVLYDEMMDFINDFDAHKVGEEFIITSAPTELLYVKTPADKFGNQSYKGLFYLEGVTEDDTPSYSVLTSKAMLESVKREAEYEPVILRMTATIVESKGKFDVYRTPFVTKIEGFNSEGDVIWTAVGDKAAKLNFTH
jgi:hypothetical protein